MKLCKDCRHYEASHNCDGGTLLPGIFMYFPATCGREITSVVISPIDGTERGGLRAECSKMRADELKCGLSGHLFEPANLDGRLAMLEEPRAIKE